MATRFFLIYSVMFLFLWPVSAEAQTNETEAKAGDWPDFKLSAEAVAAGVDGKIQIGLTISAEGKASNIKLYGGPMWPCGIKDQPDAVEDVRKAVRQYLSVAKFQPATKNGKPKASDVQITFLLSDLFKNAANAKQIEENLQKDIYPPLVEVGNIDRFALQISKQLSRLGNSPSYRLSEVQILVDESGRVVSAGGFRIDPTYLSEARRLACSATFKPIVFRQRTIRMSGILTFGLY